MATVKPVPEGYHTVTPSLTIDGAQRAIEVYKKALGAEVRAVMTGPDGKVMHGEIKVGDSILMINDPFPGMGMGPSQTSFYLYLNDADAAYKRAVEGGFTGIMPPADMFWGDRCGAAKDPFGNFWNFATHKADPTPEEMEKGRKAWEASQKPQ